MKTLLLMILVTGAYAQALTIQSLRCQGRSDPIGIEDPHPQLGWILISDRRAEIQTKYQILVATSSQLLANNTADLWDSGVVASDDSAHVLYAGKMLPSLQRCWWKSRVWDGDGKTSEWSAPAQWSMGLLEASDWKGKWIGPADEKTNAPFASPLLRKAFLVDKTILRATATICGLGYYELYLNGSKVGDHVLDPGFTRFDKRVLYVTYDVTGQLRQGNNAIGVMLGGGWYHLATPDLFGFEKAPWTAAPKVRMQIDVELADGSHQTIVSDESWKSSTGAIRFQCVRGGETIDFRMNRAGWTNAEYDDKDWSPAAIVPAPAGKLVSQKQPAIKIAAIIPAIELKEPKPGIYVYKLAVNTAGWARFTTSGQPGQKITLRFSESLNPDGTISMQLSSHTHGRYQTGEMILKGDGPETYEPHFTYHGFQYVQIEGLAAKPRLEDLVGIPVHTALPVAGQFDCSNDTINRTQQIILRTYLNNLQSIPTDCPQREKMGWLCDGMVASEMALMNFDAAAFYEKWIDDMVDAQGTDGSMPSIVPTCGWSETGHPGADFQCPWWGGAIVVVPWNVYLYTGDIRVLDRHYDAMKRYVDQLGSRAKDGIVEFGLGDWLEVGINGRPVRTPTALTSTMAYARFADLVSRAAKLTGRADDAQRYALLSQKVRDAFNRRFLKSPGVYGDDTQTAPAMALFFNLSPEDQRPLVSKYLIDNVLITRKGHLSTGLLGTLYLFKTLEELDRNDVAFSAVTAAGFPGYLHMLDAGATTLWEDWPGEGSHDHPALGSAGVWFYTSLAGIRPDPAHPGFKHVIIHPPLGLPLTYASATHDSPYGPIVCHWSANPAFKLHVSIPPNASATVYLPAPTPDAVTESGKQVSNSPGVRFVRSEAKWSIFEIGSGDYHFGLPAR